MRRWIDLFEAQTEVIEINRRKVEIYRNPNRQIMHDLMDRYSDLRAFIDHHDDLFVWDARMAITDQVAEVLGTEIKDQMVIRHGAVNCVEDDTMLNGNFLRAMGAIPEVLA